MRIKILSSIIACLSMGLMQTTNAQLIDSMSVVGGEHKEFISLTSKNFVIHGTQDQRALATRALEIAEQAHAEFIPFFDIQLKERTHMVLSDNHDMPNGWAMPFGFAQIRLFVNPPETGSLANYDEWLRLLIRHEYTHILHMDSVRGINKQLQRVLGRNPMLFPHVFQPTLFLEGLAVYSEGNKKAKTGRLYSSYYDMQMRMEVAQKRLLPLSDVALGIKGTPRGKYYLYGAYFTEYLVQRFGKDKLQAFIHHYSSEPMGDVHDSIKKVYEHTADELWQEFLGTMEKRFTQKINTLQQKQVSGNVRSDSITSIPMVFTDTGLLAYLRSDNDKPVFHRYAVDTGNTQADSIIKKAHQVNIPITKVSDMDWNDSKGLFYTKALSYTNGQVFYDVFRYSQGKEQRITEKARFRRIRFIDDNWMIASRKINGLSELWLLSTNAKDSALLWQGGYNDVLGGFDVSPDGSQLVASFKANTGRWNLVSKDIPNIKKYLNRKKHALTLQKKADFITAFGQQPWQTLTQTNAIENDPSFVDNKSIVFSADYDGIYNIYSMDLATQQTSQLTAEVGGAFSPKLHQSGLWYQTYSPDGFELRQLANPVAISTKPQTAESLISASTAMNENVDSKKIDNKQTDSKQINDKPTYTEQEYSALAHMMPRSWLPMINFDQGWQIGLNVYGHDALRQHIYDLSGYYDDYNNSIAGQFSYQYGNLWMLGLSRQIENTDTLTTTESQIQLIRQDILQSHSDQSKFDIGLLSHNTNMMYDDTDENISTEDIFLGMQWQFDSSKYLPEVAGTAYGTDVTFAYELGNVKTNLNTLACLQYNIPCNVSFKGKSHRLQTQISHTFDLPNSHTLSATALLGYSNGLLFSLGGVDNESKPDLLFSDYDKKLNGYAEETQRGKTVTKFGLTWQNTLYKIRKNMGLSLLGIGDIAGSVSVDVGSAFSDKQSIKLLPSMTMALTTEVALNSAVILPMSIGYAQGLDAELGEQQIVMKIGFMH